jgi:3-oxoacyl-(acyl-carrier-protein) synthase
VFAVAERMLRLGQVDAAVVGGTDSLCGSVPFGFHALQLVSPEPCRPFDRRRSSINLGEAAGIVDAAFSLLAIETGRVPGTLNSDTLDPVCGPQIRLRPEPADVRVAVSHSFGFGGTNCVLVFARGG